MKKILLIILLLIPNIVLASNFKLEKLIELDQPWSLTFVEGNKILISEKSGSLFLYDEKNNLKSKINHNLEFNDSGQGGLLEILSHKDEIYICYSEDRGSGKSSTSIAKADFSQTNLDFKNIFQANPPINSGYHFGCRMVIKDDEHYSWVT